MTPSPTWRPPTLLAQPRVASITARQADVLAGVCHGHSNQQIGDRLGLTEDTVKTHMRHILAALGARNRAHAAALVCTGQLTVGVRDDHPLTVRRDAA